MATNQAGGRAPNLLSSFAQERTESTPLQPHCALAEQEDGESTVAFKVALTGTAGSSRCLGIAPILSAGQPPSKVGQERIF